MLWGHEGGTSKSEILGEDLGSLFGEVGRGFTAEALCGARWHWTVKKATQILFESQLHFLPVA